MKNRKLVIGLLVMLAFVVSSFTYAYWAGAVNAPVAAASDNATVEIGTAANANTSITIEFANLGGVLVPTGKAQVGQVDLIDFDISVLWKGAGNDGTSAEGAVGTLGIVSYTVVNPSTVDVSSLFNLTLQSAASITAQANDATTGVDYTFRLTMNEPANVAAYNSVAGLTLTLTITLNVTV